MHLKSFFNRFDCTTTGYGPSREETTLTCVVCPHPPAKFTVPFYARKMYGNPQLTEHPGIQAALLHLETDHNIAECTLCGSYMTKRGMKHHQNGKDCWVLRRQKAMYDRGYEPFLSFGILEAILQNKAKILENSVEWDNHDDFVMIDAERIEALRHLQNGLGIVKATTSYIGKEWSVQTWAPGQTVLFFDLMHDVHVNYTTENCESGWEHNFLQDVTRFIEMEDKDAAIGLLELTKESQQQR